MKQRVNTSRKPNPENSPADQSGSRRRTIQPTVPLPEVIHQNIKTAVELHARHEQDVPRHQRSAEAVTAFFGRLVFLYSILLVIVLWVTPNFLPRRFGIARFDPPPFSKLQFSLTVGSLLTTAGVLMKQNRQEKLVQKRAQLSLQLNLLSELQQFFVVFIFVLYWVYIGSNMGQFAKGEQWDTDDIYHSVGFCFS